MTRLASRDARNQDVARFRARQRLRVAAHTSEAAMRLVIEFGMREPLLKDSGSSDFRNAEAAKRRDHGYRPLAVRK